MLVSDRMLIGSIASNPGYFDGAGVYRYCRSCHTIFFTSAQRPDPAHSQHQTLDLPALNPDGSNRMVLAFQEFARRVWAGTARLEQIETFARRKGWDMAMELKYGGGALEDDEAALWQDVVNRELQRLVERFRAQLEN